MQETTILSLATVFNKLFSREPVYTAPVYDTAESRAEAKSLLEQRICPACTETASFDTVHMDTDCNTELMCRSCGIRWKFDVQGNVLGTNGYDRQIHAVHLNKRANKQRQAEEEKQRREAAVMADQQYKRHAA